MFRLRFNKEEINYWANQYKITDDLIQIETKIAPQIMSTHFFEPDDFKTVCDWKSPRPRRYRELNSVHFIRSTTYASLTATNEQERVRALIKLKGVGWPTASALLHFSFKNQYPILDFRALWSLGIAMPSYKYNFEFWLAYTNFCRNLADSCGVSMSILDRALWTYSKINQPSNKSRKSCTA